MKLSVRVINTPRGPKLALTDEAGLALPLQLETTLQCGLGDEPDRFTVTFLLDGERVRLVA